MSVISGAKSANVKFVQRIDIFEKCERARTQASMVPRGTGTIKLKVINVLRGKSRKYYKILLNLQVKLTFKLLGTLSLVVWISV